jgi:hypothetical protein
MNNRSGIIKEYTQNFLTDEQKLRKIVDVIKDHSKRLSYETYLEFYVEREQEVFYTTHDIEEVLQDDNSSGEPILVITIALYKSDPTTEKDQKSLSDRRPIVFVGFTPKKETKIRFSVLCESRDWTLLVSDELDTQIKRHLKRGGFRLFQYSDYFLGLVIIYLGQILSTWLIDKHGEIHLSSAEINALTPNEQIQKILEITINRSYEPVYLLLCGFIVSWLIGGFLIAFRPISKLIGKTRTSFFYWGDMIQVYQKAEQRNTLLKWSLGISLIVSIGGSIIGTLILS